MKDKFVGAYLKPHDNSLESYVGRANSNNLDIICEDIISKLDIKSNDRVLDVCCGNGILTKRISKYCNEIHGVDFSEILIKMAKERSSGQNIHYYTEDALNIDKMFPKKFFDKIYCYFSFQFDHSKGKTLITKLFPLLRENGMLLIGDIPDKTRKFNFYSTPYRKTKLLFFLILNKLFGTKGYLESSWWYSPDEIRKLCKEININCEVLYQNENLPHAHYRFDVLIQK